LSWQLFKVENPELLLPLYQKVFDDDLSAADLEQRTRGWRTHAYLIKKSGQDPAGFALFRGKGSDAELWQAGVIPEKRLQGAGSFLLDEGEKEMAGMGYHKISVSTYNRWNIMLSMLFKRGYRLVSSSYSERRQDLKIILCRELKQRRELRYALTEKCNFNCLFCHNEGLGRERRKRVPDEHVLKVLKEAISLGYTDLTLTGGEPMLEKDRLHFLIRQLAKLPSPPALTLVTNGSLLGRQTIDLLAAYPGRKKIHLSLHAPNQEAFKRVTRTAGGGIFEKVRENISACSASGLIVKVNYVVLQGLNHQSVCQAVEMARDMGASTIKFIELLVLPENARDYEMYYDADGICELLAPIAHGPLQTSLRKRQYQLKEDSRFAIEVQKLTCALGCAHCREVRDRTFSSDLRYHPCFVRSKSSFKVHDPENLDRILKDGDRIINGYASRYMDSSPTLIQKEIYVAARQEMFYAVDDPDEFTKFLQQQKFSQVGASRFHEEYYWPQKRSSCWERFERVLKIGWDYHHETRVELIFTDHEYVPGPEGLITRTRFLDSTGPIRQKSADFARHFLDRLGFEPFMFLEWEIQVWQKEKLAVNIGLMKHLSTVKVEGRFSRAAQFAEVLRSYPGRIEPLMVPLPRFILDNDA